MMCYVILLKLMADGRKDILSVNIEPEIKEKLKEYAKKNRWSMSQSAAYLIEKGLDDESQAKLTS
jgi:hypothetical protein